MPNASDRTFKPGDEVMLWRENIVNNRIGKWLGQYKNVTSEPDKKIVLVDQYGETNRYSVAQVKPNPREADSSVNFLSQVINTFRKCEHGRQNF